MSGIPVLVIGSYRDDDQPDLYQQLPHMQMMKLRRLDEQSIAELSAAMLGDAGRTPQVVDLLQRETEGPMNRHAHGHGPPLARVARPLGSKHAGRHGKPTPQMKPDMDTTLALRRRLAHAAV
jgi:hypothetical protein